MSSYTELHQEQVNCSNPQNSHLEVLYIQILVVVQFLFNLFPMHGFVNEFIVSRCRLWIDRSGEIVISIKAVDVKNQKLHDSTKLRFLETELTQIFAPRRYARRSRMGRWSSR